MDCVCNIVAVTKTNLVVHEDKNRVPYVKVSKNYQFTVLLGETGVILGYVVIISCILNNCS